MPKALQHNYPAWQDDPHAEDSNGESREVWYGAMRIVSPRRARKLRKRGVPLMPLHAVVQYVTPGGDVRPAPTTPNGRARYAWFECKTAAEDRKRTKALQCYLVATRPEPFGRKGWLAARLETQRCNAQSSLYFRQLAKDLTGFRRMPASTPRYELHNNPQLDLYAAAWRAMNKDIVDFWRTHDPQTATGHALDALMGKPWMPTHWTDEQKRHYIQHGYVVEEGPPLQPGDRDMRKAPNVVAWIPGTLSDRMLGVTGALTAEQEADAQKYVDYVRSVREQYAGRIHENTVQHALRDVETSLREAGYVPEGDGALADSWVKPDSTG